MNNEKVTSIFALGGLGAQRAHNGKRPGKTEADDHQRLKNTCPIHKCSPYFVVCLR